MSEGLPLSWVISNIGNISEIVGGGTPNSSDKTNFCSPPKGIPWLSPVDLSGYKAKYISHGRRNLSENGYKSSSAKLIPKGTVVLSSRAPIGYVAIANNPLSTNQGFRSIVPHKYIFNEYIYYYLYASKAEAEKLHSGSTFKEISGTKLKQLPIPLPPLNEQKRIVAKLDAIMPRIEWVKERLEKIPAILKRFRQSVRTAAVTGKITGCKEYEKLPFKDLILSIRGGSTVPPQKDKTDFPILRSSSVRQGKINYGDVFYLQKEHSNVLSRQWEDLVVRVVFQTGQLCRQQARSGESLTSLGLDKLDQIRAQSQETDWSIKIVTDAMIDHLDPVAIGKARESYARKYSNRFSLDEIQGWSDIAFLDRSRLTIEGKNTRAALLLLGKPESAFLLSPHPVQMTWKLEGAERAYEHFGLPFLLNSKALYQKIRNVQIRILPDNQLFPVEVSKYEQKIVLEALHNCIAHQDYTKNGRVIVTEYLDMLVFENEGSFYEGKPADYISGEKTPRRYGNAFLAHAKIQIV